MKNKIILAVILVLSLAAASAQQRTYYEQSRDLYLNAAAKTKCPERASYLRQMPDDCNCAARTLGGEKLTCTRPSGDAPACPADGAGGGGGTSGSAVPGL